MPDGSIVSGRPDAYHANPLGVFPFSIESAGRELVALNQRYEAAEDVGEERLATAEMASVEKCILVSIPRSVADAVIMLGVGTSEISNGNGSEDGGPIIEAGEAAVRRATLYLLQHHGLGEELLPWMLYLGKGSLSHAPTSTQQDVQRLRWLGQRLNEVSIAAVKARGGTTASTGDVGHPGHAIAEQMHAACRNIIERILVCQATTLEGLIVKMRAVAYCLDDSDIVEELLPARRQTTDMHVLASLLTDIQTMSRAGR